jgi:opacity protein-like surface antigen
LFFEKVIRSDQILPLILDIVKVFVIMSNQENCSNLRISEKKTVCHQGFYGKYLFGKGINLTGLSRQEQQTNNPVELSFRYNPSCVRLCSYVLLGIGTTFSPSVLANPEVTEVRWEKESKNLILKDQTAVEEHKLDLVTPESAFELEKPQFSSSNFNKEKTKNQSQSNRISWEYNPSPRSVTTQFDWSNDTVQGREASSFEPEPIIPETVNFPESEAENNLNYQLELNNDQRDNDGNNQSQLTSNQESNQKFDLESELIADEDHDPSEESSMNVGDPELGIIRLRELPKPPTESPAKLYLIGGLGYVYGDNIFSLVDPVDDSIFTGGLTLLFTQMIDPKTMISASVGGSLNRYIDQSEYDYNQMRLNLNLYRQVTKTTYFEFGWTNQQLFNQSDGDRFLNDHSAYLEIGRKDWFNEQLYLDSYYQFRRRFADPGDRSQTVNAFGLFLGYNPYSKLNVGLGYNLGLSGFVEGDRYDVYHQLIGRLTYSINDNSRVYLFGGGSFGNSSDDDINFNGFIFGVGIDFNLNLF